MAKNPLYEVQILQIKNSENFRQTTAVSNY